MNSKRLPLSLALLILISGSAGMEAQANLLERPAWGYGCNPHGLSYSSKLDCQLARNSDDDDDEKRARDQNRRRDRDQRLEERRRDREDDRFNRSLVIERISDRDFPPALSRKYRNEVFRVVRTNRNQVIVLLEDGQVLSRDNSRTAVSLGFISPREVDQFERLLQTQDFERFDRRSYSLRRDRTTVVLSSQDTTVAYELNAENQLPQPLRRVIDTFEQLVSSARTSPDYERDRDRATQTISAGTVLRVENSNSNRIVLRRNERFPLRLRITRDVTDSRGRVLISEGSTVEGELRPAGDGTRFEADRLILRNRQTYNIEATSEIIKGDRTVGSSEGTTVSSAARVVLGSITGGRGRGLGNILGDVLAGTGSRNSDVLAVYLDDLDLTLRRDLDLSELYRR